MLLMVTVPLLLWVFIIAVGDVPTEHHGLLPFASRMMSLSLLLWMELKLIQNRTSFVLFAHGLCLICKLCAVVCCRVVVEWPCAT